MDDTDKKIMLKNLLEVIQIADDKEYQQRVWIEIRGPECYTPDDFFNDFADFSEIILKDYKNYGLTENQYNLLKKFYEEFDALPYSIERELFMQEWLDSPEWTKITEMAKEVLKAFNWKKSIS